ncbi:hypothetical protein [Streptomyces mirabilis]|uniref:hypothetical protein n=1 Tax=Streptomyces mirabilis TaxID=68239 RepID=UPI0033D595A9
MPSRTTVGVTDLALDAAVEIDVIAAISESTSMAGTPQIATWLSLCPRPFAFGRQLRLPPHSSSRCVCGHAGGPLVALGGRRLPRSGRWLCCSSGFEEIDIAEIPDVADLPGLLSVSLGPGRCRVD